MAHSAHQMARWYAMSAHQFVTDGTTARHVHVYTINALIREPMDHEGGHG